MRRQKNSFPVKPLLFVFIILLAFSFILGYIWRILTTSDYFKVKDVVSNGASNADLSYLKGRDIFRLDLAREAAYIAMSCPDCSRVRLARVIPDRIFVEFVRRKPVALIKLYRYFAVDAEGVIFYSDGQPGLPVISGLETEVFGPKPGKRYKTKGLSMALSIIKEAGRIRLLKDYKIQKINVAGVDNITVQIPIVRNDAGHADWKAPGKEEFLEVKFGQGDIRDKAVIMAGLLNQEKHNLGNIKYIDLRFNEPVIKFKDAK